MGKCFVSGCKSGGYTPITNKNIGLRNPSVFRPRNSETLKKWSKIIGRTDKEMTMKDCVCELHFERKYIQRYYEHRLTNGAVCKIKRGLPRLSPGAVPSIFSNLPFNVLKKCNEPDVVHIDAEISTMESHVESTVVEKNSSNIKTHEKLTFAKENSINMKTHEILTAARENSIHMKIHEKTIVGKENCIKSPFECNQNSTVFNFVYLLNNFHQVKRPSASWTITIISEIKMKYVMCAKWNTYLAERKVVIDPSLNIKVFLKDREISTTIHEVKCMDDIADLLKSVDGYALCHGIDNKEMSHCVLYTERSLSGRPKVWCKECRIVNRKQYKKVVNRKKKIDREKKRIYKNELMYKRLVCVQRQNTRLRQKVIRLKRRLEIQHSFFEV